MLRLLNGRLLAGAALVACLAPAAQAQTIYPIDRAEILAGQKFDLKVEFPGVIDAAKAKVTINGQDAAAVLGKSASFKAKDGDVDASALMLRDAAIAKPGTYEVTATDGTNTKTVKWEVYATGPRTAKNVVFLIGDGMSLGHRTAARIMSKGIKEGKYLGTLSMDDMSNMALIGTSGVDSIVTDSANSASAYNSGHKSSVNALGVYADRTKDSQDDPKVELIGELAKRKLGMAVGIVSDAELEDATPAAVVAHTRRRADKADIAMMAYNLRPEVMLGGGSAYFLPQATAGSKRKDDKNLVDLFKKDGYQVTTTSDAMLKAAGDAGTTKLLGLFAPGNMDNRLDRTLVKPASVQKLPNQPDLTDMAKSALEVLSRNKNGFVLMIESALIDKASHPLDAERAAYNTIMLDKTVQLVKDWAAKNGNDTLIMVMPDHTHAISVVGTVDDSIQAKDMRDKIGTYAAAGYPNYVDADHDGYPDTPDVSKRLYMVFGDYPDHYETYRPKMDGQFNPAVKNKDGVYVANEAYKDVPGAVFVPGNLPHNASDGVHSADDGILTAMGPGADRVHGFVENVEVFRTMAEALGLGEQN